MSSIWVSTRGTQDQPRPMVFSAFGSTLKSSLIASTDGLIMRIGRILFIFLEQITCYAACV